MSLSTHVLDIVRGCGAAGMMVELCDPDGKTLWVELDEGGRATLLDDLKAGIYEISFHAGAYQEAYLTQEFYDVIPVRFTVTDPTQKYHIPLVLSAYGYSTYRGG
jgi:5-hydroxyisourate hydrolase